MESDSPFAHEPDLPPLDIGSAVDETIDRPVFEKVEEDVVETTSDPDHAAPGTPAAIPGDEQVITEVKCAKCATRGSWRGQLTDEMLERTFTRGVGPDGLPNCPHCGTPMEFVPVLTAAEAFAKAGQELEADLAGDAARPVYQPSIPGIHPPFDWRRAQLTTESLETNVASAERLWESAKKTAAACKSDFDDAVSALREHIQETHRARVDAEFQARRPASEPAPAGEVDVEACAFERETGKPCPICRNPVAGIRPADNTILGHVAAAAVTLQANDQLEAAGLRRVILALAGVELLEETVRGWSAVERAQVLRYLEAPGVVKRPEILGTAHEAADPSGQKQACRICGAPMPFLPDDTKTWPIGQKVGTDCPGEPGIEPARPPTKRHAKTADASKAKQADRAASSTKSAPKRTKKGRR